MRILWAVFCCLNTLCTIKDCVCVKFVHEENYGAYCILSKCDRWSLGLLLWQELWTASYGFSTSLETNPRLRMFILKKSTLYSDHRCYHIIPYYMQMNSLTLCISRHLNELDPKFSSVDLCFNRPAVRVHSATEAAKGVCVNV